MALNAINQPLNTKESKYRELSTLMQFDQKLEEDNQKEVAAQMTYTNYEQSVNSFSESLLEGDRKQIQNKARDLQADLKEEIRNAGSYKKFMENGGVRMLAKYQDNVVNSEEAKIYSDNAKNMAHIIKAIDFGKAGLLTTQDLKNLQDYKTNGYGKLSYSGLLSEVDMPDEQAYELGTQVPAEEILGNKNNYSAILSNFMREHPEEGVPTGDRLTKYVEERYNLRGKNTQILQLKMQNKQRAAKAKAERDKKANKRKHSTWALSTNDTNNINGAGLDGKAKGFHPNSNYDEHYAKASTAGIVTNRKFELYSETDQDWNPWDTPAMRLKDARIHGGFDGTWKKALASESYAADRANENGTYKFNPVSDGFYGADGSKSEIDKSFNLTPINVVHASRYTDKNGVSRYVTQFVDGDGNLKEDENAELFAEMSDDVTAFMEPTEVWKDEESGYIYYRPIPQDSMSFQSAFTESIKNEDDVTDMIQIEQGMKQDKNIIAAQLALNKSEVRERVNQTYSSPEFQKSMNDKVIDKFNFPSNEQIFAPLITAYAMSNKTITGGKNKKGEYNLMAPSVSATEIDKANDYLATLFTRDAITGLRDKNLTMEKAYGIMSKQLKDTSDESDKEGMNLLLSYWKSLYESKSGRKFRVETN